MLDDKSTLPSRYMKPGPGSLHHLAAVRGIPEVEACHIIAGGFDYLIKVCTSDIFAYRQVLGEQLSRLPNVASTSTYISMQSVVDTAPIDL